MKKCLYCGKEFVNKKHKESIYCCKSCSVKNRYKEDVGLFRKDVPKHIKKYLLGLFITDGCITRNNSNTPVMIISLKDKEMIEEIRNIVCPNKKIYKDKNNYQVRWRNNNDKKIFNILGIHERKTYTVPFLKINGWDFIRGIFDGDGTVYISKTKYKNNFYYYHCISFTSGCEQFANDLNTFFKNNNINSKIYKDCRKNTWYVRILNKKDVEFIKNKMYENEDIMFLKRKHDVFQK